MYSYEDRIRTVRLYIKLGKRIGATLRQLGYPTKNSLKSWYREFEHRQDLPVAAVRTWQKYSDEQKQAAVEHYGSYLGEISPAPENLINRDFQAGMPNEKWLTDITEFQIPAGKVYPILRQGHLSQASTDRCGGGYQAIVQNRAR